MAKQVPVFGPADVQVDTGTSSAFESLGYTENGVDTTQLAHFHDVKGDENGGQEGPPIEIIYLGEIARIRCVFTKWDLAVRDKVAQRARSSVTAGDLQAVGTRMFADSEFYAIKLIGATLNRTFSRVIFRDPIEINFSSKNQVLVLEAEAHKDASGNLFVDAANA